MVLPLYAYIYLIAYLGENELHTAMISSITLSLWQSECAVNTP